MAALFLAALAIAVLSPGEAFAEKPRLAIIGGNATEPARSYLTVQFSQLPEVAVVELAEIEKTVAKQSLQLDRLTEADAIHVGQLLHADLVLVLVKDEHRDLLTERLIALAPGMALLDETTPLPIPDSDHWTPYFVKRAKPYLVSFADAEHRRIPLSILRLHSIAPGETARQQEDELGFLLTRRLMNEPSLWVLQRSQMDLPEWEKSLQTTPQAGFWTGSYLLDGAIAAESGGYTATARLRAAAKGDEISLKAHAADLPKLAESLASQIAASLKLAPPAKAWDALGEATQFQEEAQWAYHWRLYEEASRASEAAWALGLRSEDLAVLRCHSEASRLPNAIFLNQNGERKRPPVWALESASLTLDRLQEGLAGKGKDLSERWVGLASNCLWQCSLVLRAYYYEVPNLEAAEAAKLKALRQRIRSLCEELKPAGEKFPALRYPANDPVLRNSLGDPGDLNLYVLRGLAEPIWQDEASQCVQKMKSLFEEIDQLPERARIRIKENIIAERPTFCPWIAYWNPEDRARVPLTALRDALLDSTVVERPIDVSQIFVERRKHVILDYYAGRFNAQQSLIALLDLEAAVWDARENIVRKAISPQCFFGYFDAIRSAENATNEYASPTVDAGLPEFKMKWFRYLLEQHLDEWRYYSWILPRASELPEEARREFLPLIGEMLVGDKARDFRRLYASFATGQDNPPPMETPAHLPFPRKRLKPVWSVDGKALFGQESLNVQCSRWADGRLWVLARDMGTAFWKQPNLILTYDPKTAATTQLRYPEKEPLFQTLERFQGDLYCAGEGKLARYTEKGRQWKDLSIPNVPAGDLWMLDGKIYSLSAPGVVVRFDPSSGKSEVLASSRRRPALSILDDTAPYQPSKVFKDSGDHLCLLNADGAIYRYDENSRAWSEAFRYRNALKPGEFDRDLLLHAVGQDGIPLNGETSPFSLAAKIANLLLLDNKVDDPATKQAPLGMPRMRLPGIAMLSARCAAFDGKTLWILANETIGTKPVIGSISETGETQQIFWFDIGPGGEFPNDDRIELTPEGLLLKCGGKISFFGKGDLAK